jgi:uncharacterized protein involved in outer membrane biogenesis
MKRWLVRILVALLLLAAVGLLAKNLLIRKGLEAGVTEVTGFPLAIGSFDLGLFNARVDVKDLRLSNPPGFEDPRCLLAPRLLADVELKSVFREELHVQEVDLDVEEVVVVKNTKGETNLDRLEALAGGDDGGKAPGAKGPGAKEPGAKEPGAKDKGAGKAKERKWRCDRLHLKLGRVVYLDYTSMKGGKPKEETFDLKVDEHFKNVRGPEQIVKILVLKVLTRTPITLLRASVDSLTSSIGDAAEKALGGSAKDALGGLLGGGDDRKKEPQAPPAPPKKPTKKK